LNDRAVEDLAEILPPLLNVLDALGFISRHFHPPHFADLMAVVGAPDAELRAVHGRLRAWPDELAGVRAGLDAACDLSLVSFAALHEARSGDPDSSMRSVHRALRWLPRAQEALYPLAAGVPPVSRFFLNGPEREDGVLQDRLWQSGPRENVGVLHARNAFDERGGFSIYVPEYYSAEEAWPVVFALHGGGGHGRAFLWSWLRDARSRGVILVAPTSVGSTWALADDDPDSPHLARVLDFVRAQWNVDESRVLMTGMSDGGTFCYASGLEAGSPFTHLAPAGASFHPILAQLADPKRLAGLPIHITHGALDWMFPVTVARTAEESLSQAGANVTYVEIDDLSHCYPRELNPQILDWMART
jgi:phospholipase/carboxylesterase